jgi:hypothetical protein
MELFMELEDLSLMPYGKHKGIPMQDVPVSYLHWLWQNGLKQQTSNEPVAKYIQKSLTALKQENKDLIWS